MKVMRSRLSILFVCCFLIHAPTLQGQEVGGFFADIKKRVESNDYLRLAGNLQAGLRWNSIAGINPRISPFQANINAGLLVDFLGIKGPFSAAFSNSNTTYQLPAYAFYGFSPAYKWIQLHFGDRSLNFSPYTLNGHNFRGVGIELKPGNFYVGMMRGRLRRERQIEAGAIQNLDPIYRRIGSSLKLGFDNGSDQLGLIFFHAQDDENSIELPDSIRTNPQENLVLEFQAKKQLGQLFNIGINVAHSALTRDKNAPVLDGLGSGLNGTVFGLFDARSSTSYNQAYNFKLAFTPEFAQFNLQYERLGLGFRSLGTLAFLNDTEQLSVGGNTSLANKKVNLSANLGIQRNGISQQTVTSGSRLIGSLNLGVAFSDRLNSSFSVSNFNYSLRQRIATVPFVVVDSIVIVQSNFSAQASTSYLLDETGQSSIAISGAYQVSSSINGDEVEATAQNKFYSLMTAYTLNNEDKNLSLTLSNLLNLTEFADLQTSIISPSISVQKALADGKLNADGGFSMSFVSTAGISASQVMEARVGSSWEISKKQAIRFQLSYVNNRSRHSNSQFDSFQAWNGSLNYRLSF